MLNKTLCNDSSILLLLKQLIFKWVEVPDVWEGHVENKVKCEKMVIFPGLSKDFSRLSLTHQSTLFYTFSDQIHPLPKSQKAQKFKKLYFWTNLKQFE